MSEAISTRDAAGALDAAARLLDRAVRNARGREIDDQQVAVARLADLATEHRSALDLLSYAEGAGEGHAPLAVSWAGQVVSRIGRLVDDHAADHGLTPEDALDRREREFARGACAEPRLREIGQGVARDRGRNESPLGETLEQVRASVREFADGEVAPSAEAIHRRDLLVPESFIEQMSALGYFGLSIDEAYGGTALGHVAMCITTEELSRASLAAAGSLITRPEILAKALLAGGTEEQKRTWLPRIASGEAMVAVGVTEPDIGSDVASVKCRAEPARVGGREGWAIDGPKAWCTFAGRADIIALLARTDPDPALGARGLSLFIVPKPRFDGREFEYRQPGGGRIVGKADATPGYRGLHSFSLNFERYFVPADHLIGEEGGRGRGFYLQMGGFAAGRLQTGARATGLAQAALERTSEYVLDRSQFGRPLIDFQLTQYRLGWMATRVAAARAITYAAAEAMDRDARAAAPYAAQAKLLACDTAVDVTQAGQLLHGGWGYAEEYPISRYVVDAQVLPIFEGVKPTLQLKVVGRALLA
ncbi:MAG: acyl-CoA/acyl-ACP dehydrogenase [Proteobacteria bacterium]|nr:acyl-CoA/acyl-ACP dehydrogenase [Pseudomonadota bacterium]